MGTYKGEEPSGMFSLRPTLPVSAVCAQNNHVREKDYFQSENLNPSPPKKRKPEGIPIGIFSFGWHILSLNYKSKVKPVNDGTMTQELHKHSTQLGSRNSCKCIFIFGKKNFPPFMFGVVNNCPLYLRNQPISHSMSGNEQIPQIHYFLSYIQ